MLFNISFVYQVLGFLALWGLHFFLRPPRSQSFPWLPRPPWSPSSSGLTGMPDAWSPRKVFHCLLCFPCPLDLPGLLCLSALPGLLRLHWLLGHPDPVGLLGLPGFLGLPDLLGLHCFCHLPAAGILGPQACHISSVS